MNAPVSKHTLFEYLSGRANPLERQAVEAWLRDPANQEFFFECLLEWETLHPQVEPDTEPALRTLNRRIDTLPVGHQPEVPTLAPPTRFPFSFRLAAAVTGLLLLAGAGWFWRDALVYRSYQTGYGQVESLVLPDGSRVTLNANSRLRVPRWGFNAGTREVNLRGEAEFSVVHTRDHRRFVVKTDGDLQVEVLGTEFTLFARPRGTRVVLNQGKIRVDYGLGGQRKQLVMKPGDWMSLPRKGGLRLGQVRQPAVAAAWKEHRFVFNNSSVREIATLLEEHFGVTVTLADSTLASRSVSGNFKAQTADELLSLLSAALGLDVRRTPEGVLLAPNPDN